jgi:3',5'-nucleoside bisphosphate phosphatase
LIDLHCHTTCSDGTLTPSALLEKAQAMGISFLAVTDHDTIQAYGMIRDAASEIGIELLCGVELSTHLAGCERSVHLLGYFAEEPGAIFREWLERLQESRMQRNAELLSRLQELGVKIEWSEVQALAQRQVGRPHFAAALLQKGYVRSLKEAFDIYLSEGGKAWVERDEPSLAVAVEMVRRAGGLPSLAHPIRISCDWTFLEETIRHYAAHGLGALECFHPEHSRDDVWRMCALAEKYGLAMTGGSDFHGATKPGIELGTGHEGNLRIPQLVGELFLKMFAETESSNGHGRAAKTGNPLREGALS